MRIDCCDNLNAWQRWQSQWDGLAGDCTFRTWRWLSTWWKHYGERDPRRRKTLRVLLAIDDDGLGEPQLAAALPCYVDSHPVAGRTVRLLGDGEACSDHLGLLARPGRARAAAAELASQLMHDGDWDLLQFEAIDDADEAVAALAVALSERGALLERRPGPACWAIDLPGNWDAFLALQSKSHRKQLRRLETRVLDSPQATWRLVESPRDFDEGWRVLTLLHQRRRRSLGEPGCFSWPRWAAFHRDVAEQLLAAGELRLSWLELAGRPVAAEYHFCRGGVALAYQGGLDPDAADAEPGRLSMIATLKRALAEGVRRFDLLRGDEPYKAHWRAEPHATHDLFAVPPRFGAQARYKARRAARQAARYARQATRRFG
ncbi:MAG: GNAT family N-acetyltransferase [Pirellulales bacterium]|nr:GNAT family N-acetyltransferase [Pirellulales bacterium]